MKKSVEILFEETKKEALNIGLPICTNLTLSVNNKPKKRFGRCTKLSDTNYHIEISGITLTGHEQGIKAIIMHELIHTCKNCMNHGSNFKKYAELVNSKTNYGISRTSSMDSLGVDKNELRKNSKWLITCKDCGKEIYKQRTSGVIKYPKNYSCKCGGKLKVENLY